MILLRLAIPWRHRLSLAVNPSTEQSRKSRDRRVLADELESREEIYACGAPVLFLLFFCIPIDILCLVLMLLIYIS